MHFIFKFPDIGEGISEGKILEWYVKKGQRVKMGDALVKMETDKVVADIPSPKDGVVVTCFGGPGDTIRVEDPLVEIEIEGVSPQEAQRIAQERPFGKTEKQEDKCFGVVGTFEIAGDSAHLPASEEGTSESREERRPRVRALATPVARAMARELNVDIDEIKGSGPGGRVTKKDIEQHVHERNVRKSKPVLETNVSPELVEVSDISQIRKTIARRMVISKQTAPHMTAFEEVEISSLMALRESQKEKFKERGTPLTYLPFIIKAVTDSLRKHKAINSQFDMEKGRIIYKYYYNIGIAIDAPDGLVVPVIRNADRLSIARLASALSELSARARERKLTIEDMKDGTFSITNFGAIAGIHAVPIINYPEVGILGVGRIREVPVIANGKVEIGNLLPLSISVDHRVVDGGEVARFLKDVMERLADPVAMLLE